MRTITFPSGDLESAEEPAEDRRRRSIGFVFGKGKHKPAIQKLYEELEECSSRLMEYKECFEIMGKEWNSYSKTDLKATFMRMKEDHMQNGQLKAAYNVQIAVKNYFIVHSYVSNDRTDYNTLTLVLEKHRSAFGDTLETVTADSGYCSEKNLLYLKEDGIRSFIKIQDHEKWKTRAYKEDIGKYYNMKLRNMKEKRSRKPLSRGSASKVSRERFFALKNKVFKRSLFHKEPWLYGTGSFFSTKGPKSALADSTIVLGKMKTE